MFKFNCRNTRNLCEICSESTIKAPEWIPWRHWNLLHQTETGLYFKFFDIFSADELNVDYSSQGYTLSKLRIANPQRWTTNRDVIMTSLHYIKIFYRKTVFQPKKDEKLTLNALNSKSYSFMKFSDFSR